MQPSFVSQLFPEGSVPLIEASLRFAHHRQMALTNNIANIETPHYRRQDVSEEAFQRMLRKAIRQREELHPRDWRLESGQGFDIHENRFPEVVRVPGDAYPDAPGQGPLRHDENNVVAEAEMAALMKNTLSIRALQNLFKRAVGGTARAARFTGE